MIDTTKHLSPVFLQQGMAPIEESDLDCIGTRELMCLLPEHLSPIWTSQQARIFMSMLWNMTTTLGFHGCICMSWPGLGGWESNLERRDY